MKRMHKITAALALTALIGFGPSAQAQSTTQEAPATAAETTSADIANNTLFGDWLVACQAVTVSRNVCRLVQEQKLRDSNTLIARFIALPADDGGAILLAQVPMGVYLPGGAVFRLENDEETEQQEMIWQRCLGEICEAAQAIDAAMLEKITASGALLFGYRADAGSEPIITRVDMARFGEGLTALRATE